MAIRYPVLRPMKIHGIDVNVSMIAMVMFWASCELHGDAQKCLFCLFINIEKVLS